MTALRRWIAWTTVASLIVVFLIGILSIYRSRHRGLDIDEVEYLQTGWLMKSGQRLYVDFLEDHSPYLFLIFKAMAPAGASSDPLQYAVRARLLCGAAGVLAVACVCLIAFQITKNAVAPIIAAAVLFGSFPTWSRGIAEARSDPPALLLFWLGALLILRFRENGRSLVPASVGIGLIALAALWNPKWPLASTVFGVVFLRTVIRDRRPLAQRLLAAFGPAALLIAIGVLVIVSVTTLSNYVFFMFEYNRGLAAWFSKYSNMTSIDAGGSRPFAWCGDPFRGPYPLLAAAVFLIFLLAPRIRSRLRTVDLEGLRIVAVVVLASLLEIRFLYAYPTLAIQYYLMWSFALAVLYGCLVGSLFAALEEKFTSLATLGTVAIALLLYVLSMASLVARDSKSNDTYWSAARYLRSRLQPGDSLWLANFRRPICVPEASYYWFASGDLVPFTIHYLGEHPNLTRLPPISEEDLPVCRAANGLPTTVKLISDGTYLRHLPKTRDCLRRLIAIGKARPTAIPLIYEIVR